MAAAKAAVPVLLIAALVAAAALLLPDGSGPGEVAVPTATAAPTATGGPGPPPDTVAVLDAGAESDGALSVWRALNAEGLRVVLRPGARERRGLLVLALRGSRPRLARRIAREAQAPLRTAGPAALRRAGGPPEADVLVLVGRPG